MSQVYYNPQFGYYTQNSGILANQNWGSTASKPLWDSYVRQGFIKPIAPIQSSPSFNTASISTEFTPNKHTARQLAELQSGSMGGGGNTIPAWMHNAFANKMGRMGAPTTEPVPYQITGSSFRGMPAGKTAPTGGQ